MVTKVCQVCGKEYQVKDYRTKKSVACSVECQKQWQNKKVEVQCAVCGKKLKRKPSRAQGNVFCSNACVGKWNALQRDLKVAKICVICGKEYKVKRNEAGRSVACSRECHSKWQSKYRVGENAANWKSDAGRTKECVICGKQFQVRPYAYESAKCCSRKCHGQYLLQFNHSVSADEKRAITMKTQFSRDRSRRTILKTLSSYQIETSIEKAIREWLEFHDVYHVPQYVINKKFCVDFYLPNHNVVIEAFGDYFHANPIKYGEERKELNDMQTRNTKKDKARLAYLRKCGYSVYIFWEYDIKRDLDALMDTVVELNGLPCNSCNS